MLHAVVGVCVVFVRHVAYIYCRAYVQRRSARTPLHSHAEAIPDVEKSAERGSGGVLTECPGREHGTALGEY